MVAKGIKEDREEMRENNSSFRNLIFVAAIISAVALSSCRHRPVYSEIKQVAGAEWSRFNTLHFKADVSDTAVACDILITLRTNSDYPYRNIFLFVTTTSPEGYSVKDTIEYFLADEKGKWFGKGLGDINDLSVKFRSNVVFPYRGIYEFRIEQGMRTDNLDGVMDVGLRIVPRD